MVLQCRHWNYGPLSASSLSNIAALEYTVYQHEQAHASKSSETRPIRVSIHHEGPSTPQASEGHSGEESIWRAPDGYMYGPNLTSQNSFGTPQHCEEIARWPGGRPLQSSLGNRASHSPLGLATLAKGVSAEWAVPPAK